MAKTIGNVGIIGAGVMGQAIATALIGRGLVTRQHLWAATKSKESARAISSKYHVRCLDHLDNKLIAKTDTLILATKPAQLVSVLKDLVKRKLRPDCLVISIVTGVNTYRIEELLGGKASVIRAITNTPCVIGCAMTALVPGRFASAQHRILAHTIFEAVGECVELEERLAESVTGLSASGPAYIYLIMEALADGGVRVGLPRKTALKLVAQTVLGAALMVRESGRHPASLRDDVTTPAGCTIAGLLVMEDGKLRSTLARAVEEATNVARELGKAAE